LINVNLNAHTFALASAKWMSVA